MGLDEDNQKDVVFVVVEYDRIKAKWDDNNNLNELNAPPIMPHELIKVAPQHFISDALNVYYPVLITSNPKRRSTNQSWVARPDQAVQ